MIINNIDKVKPLVHCITNYVTVNDVANILLAANASPIMADSIKEVEQITKISNALYLNIGTANERTFESMLISAKTANKNNIPIILDPVGVGASTFRNECIDKLLKTAQIAVIRGNISEIKSIALNQNSTRGVDAQETDSISLENQEAIIDMAKKLSNETKAIIAISGKIDVICDSEKYALLYNGNQMMANITGAGCMLTSLIAAHVASNTNYFSATLSAISQMNIAGEIAYKLMQPYQGNASYRTLLIDSINKIDTQKIKENIKYEIR
ncbi:MAG: hydroxyethylthiazole kinase [Pleomorphochaeta sp.]